MPARKDNLDGLEPNTSRDQSEIINDQTNEPVAPKLTDAQQEQVAAGALQPEEVEKSVEPGSPLHPDTRPTDPDPDAPVDDPKK